MTTVNYPDVEVDANGLATKHHVAAHHVHGIPGGAELTLCGQLIKYNTWQGVAPGAPPCTTCERLDG
jgi:hypothetical protein